MHDALDREEYVRCLRRLYGIVTAWEQRAAQRAPEWLQPALAARSRTQLLVRDLAWFGTAIPGDDFPQLPAMNDLPQLLGSMYVLEGSTLGGQLIARHVEKTLHLTGGNGNAFFRGHGERTGPLWKEFCEMLKIRLSDEQAAAVIGLGQSHVRFLRSLDARRSGARCPLTPQTIVP